MRLRERLSAFGDMAAGGVTDGVATWRFVAAFLLVVAIWIGYNRFAPHPFDPPQYTLLNLMLSLWAAIQASLIMMSQNVQDKKNAARDVRDRERDLRYDENHGALLNAALAVPSDVHASQSDLKEMIKKLLAEGKDGRD